MAYMVGRGRMGAPSSNQPRSPSTRSARSSVETRTLNAAIAPAFEVLIFWPSMKSPRRVFTAIRWPASARAAPRGNIWPPGRLGDLRRIRRRGRLRWWRFRWRTRRRWRRGGIVQDRKSDNRYDKYQDGDRTCCDLLHPFQFGPDRCLSLERFVPFTLHFCFCSVSLQPEPHTLNGRIGICARSGK